MPIDLTDHRAKKTGGRPASKINLEQLFLLLAIGIGVLAGFAVVLFRLSLDYVHSILFPANATRLHNVLAPTLVGLLIGVLVVRLFPGARGSGVNQTKAALYVHDGRIPFRTVIGKFITSVLAIASGQSLGPEDPALQVGAGLASAIGRRLHLSREKVRLVAPLGAAAGLAAAFNAPISAVLFVIEEVVGRWSSGVLGAVVLAAVSGTVVSRAFLGGGPLFRTMEFEWRGSSELLAYAVLGVAGGLTSIVFLRLVLTVRPRLKGMPRWTQYFQPACAGLIVGLIGLRFPQVMGAGYNTISSALHNEITWQILLVLAFVKLFATAVSFTSGTPGGMFAPTLFMGAMLGGAIGGIERHYFPHVAGTLPAFCLVGMGTMFAGTLRAPMTSVFMVLEVSGNYEILVPVMVSNTIAYLLSRNFEPEPLFDALSRQDGLDLPSLEAQREEQGLQIEDAMLPNTMFVMSGGEAALGCQEKLEGRGADLTWIFDAPGSWHLVSAEALLRLADTAEPGQTLGELLPSDPAPHLHPDQPLDLALQFATIWPYLPVISRADHGRIMGVITLESVLAAYRERAAGVALIPS